MQAAHNQGMDVSRLFVRSVEKSGGRDRENFTSASKVAGQGGPAQRDWHLTRYAAYLVAMNGIVAPLSLFVNPDRDRPLPHISYSMLKLLLLS
jgi:hypothetical protein